MKPSVLDNQFIFVVGAPRSGTTWLAHMIGDHTAVASLPGVELTMFTRYVGNLRKYFIQEKRAIDSGKWTQGLPAIWSEARFNGFLLDFIGSVYGTVLESNPTASHIMDKHPSYANHIPTINELIPNAKFIHLIRDGREVAVSMMSVNERVGHSPGHVKEAALVWKKFVTNASAAKDLLGDRYMEVRYEDLKRDGQQEMVNVFQFCGLQVDLNEVKQIVERNAISNKQASHGDESINTIRDIPNAIWMTKMDLRQRNLFNGIAGDLLEELGYAEHGWWAVRSTDRLIVSLALPFIRIKRAISAAWTAFNKPLSA